MAHALHALLFDRLQLHSGVTQQRSSHRPRDSVLLSLAELSVAGTIAAVALGSFVAWRYKMTVARQATTLRLPDDGAPTSEWVSYGEARAAAMFAEELAGYFRLGRDVIDAAGPLVERISEQPGEPRAIHAAALLLARISSELAACIHLLKLGYAAQAVTLVGTMLELTHVLAYIGEDESRAAEWASWDKPTRTYPGPILDTIKATSAAVFESDTEAARRSGSSSM